MEGPQFFPLFHFENDIEITSFTSMLDAEHIKDQTLQSFGVTNGMTKDVSVGIYEWREKRFGCIESMFDDDMCQSSRFINEYKSPRMDVVKNIDRSRRYCGSVRHANRCNFAICGSDIINYLGIEGNPNVEFITEWLRPEGALAERPFFLNFLSADIIDDDDWANHAQPEHKKVKLEETWKELIETNESKWVKTEDEEKMCLACCEYQKTVRFWPCEHKYYCDKCFTDMMIKPLPKKVCPLCTQEFTTITRRRIKKN